MGASSPIACGFSYAAMSLGETYLGHHLALSKAAVRLVFVPGRLEKRAVGKTAQESIFALLECID